MRCSIKWWNNPPLHHNFWIVKWSSSAVSISLSCYVLCSCLSSFYRLLSHFPIKIKWLQIIFRYVLLLASCGPRKEAWKILAMLQNQLKLCLWCWKIFNKYSVVAKIKKGYTDRATIITKANPYKKCWVFLHNKGNKWKIEKQNNSSSRKQTASNR